MRTVPVVQFVIAGAQSSGVQSDSCYTIIYDGNCTVCQRLVRIIERWDRKDRLEVLPSQTPGLKARFPWIPDRAYAESVQFVEPDGTTWQGAAAIDRILGVLPRGRLISWIFRIPFVHPIAERFYRWFARNRYKFGCGEHCTYRPTDVEFEA